MTEQRSFVVVCTEIGIHDIEIMDMLKFQIHGFSIEQWANCNITEFMYNQQTLSDYEKIVLADYLRKCEVFIR